MTKYNHLTSLNQIDPFPTKLGNKIEQPDQPKTQFHHGQKLKDGFFLTDGMLGYVPPKKYDWEGLKKKLIEARKNIVLEAYPENDLTGNTAYRPREQHKREDLIDHPLNFGNMDWRPELVKVISVTNDKDFQKDIYPIPILHSEPLFRLPMKKE